MAVAQSPLVMAACAARSHSIAGRASQIRSFTSTICSTAAVNSAYRVISRRTFSTSARQIAARRRLLLLEYLARSGRRRRRSLAAARAGAPVRSARSAARISAAMVWPRIFSTTPPYRPATVRANAKYCDSSSRMASGSRASDNGVKPTTSQNSTEHTRRSATGA
jgi:hypothetical protein